MAGEFLPGGAVPEAVLDEIVRRTGLDGPALAEGLERSRTEATRRADEIRRVADREFEFLRQALESSSVRLGRPGDERLEALAARCTAHSWVELREGSKWIPLDTSFAGAIWSEAAAPGRAAPRAGARHQVEFQLTLRRTVGGEEEEKVLLEVTLHADESLDRFAAFAILPADGEEGILERPEFPAPRTSRRPSSARRGSRRSSRSVARRMPRIRSTSTARSSTSLPPGP